jgi:hypothetical protein
MQADPACTANVGTMTNSTSPQGSVRPLNRPTRAFTEAVGGVGHNAPRRQCSLAGPRNLVASGRVETGGVAQGGSRESGSRKTDRMSDRIRRDRNNSFPSWRSRLRSCSSRLPPAGAAARAAALAVVTATGENISRTSPCVDLFHPRLPCSWGCPIVFVVNRSRIC